MKIRDRIKEFRRVKASELLPHPANWRVHSDEQKDAMRGLLAEVGIAGAVLAYETDDGLRLIDGHLRTETIAANAEVPVLVLDVDHDEAKKILATFDPISAMATADTDMLRELLNQIETENSSVEAMLRELVGDEAIADEVDDTIKEVDANDGELLVIVECDTEDEQREIFELMQDRGARCRIIA